jgi:ABC-type uncharacterized transport system auxiliary subunit
MKWSILVAAVAGCALTSKSPPLEVRYYTLEAAPVERHANESRVKIRLGRVSASSHLRSRVVYRASPIEIELYETKRWAEPPETLVRRAVENQLAARRALVTGGKAMELEVEVVAFEERGAPRTAHVRLRYVMIDQRDVVVDDIVDVERPTTGDFASFVDALGKALDDASAKLVDEVIDTP